MAIILIGFVTGGRAATMVTIKWFHKRRGEYMSLHLLMVSERQNIIISPSNPLILITCSVKHFHTASDKILGRLLSLGARLSRYMYTWQLLHVASNKGSYVLYLDMRPGSRLGQGVNGLFGLWSRPSLQG